MIPWKGRALRDARIRDGGIRPLSDDLLDGFALEGRLLRTGEGVFGLD
jgi:hypothetical protein